MGKKSTKGEGHAKIFRDPFESKVGSMKTCKTTRNWASKVAWPEWGQVLQEEEKGP